MAATKKLSWKARLNDSSYIVHIGTARNYRYMAEIAPVPDGWRLTMEYDFGRGRDGVYKTRIRIGIIKAESGVFPTGDQVATAFNWPESFYIPAGKYGNPYPTIKGRPLLVVEQTSALGTAGDLVLADWSQYCLCVRVPADSKEAPSMEMAYGPASSMIEFTSSDSAGRRAWTASPCGSHPSRSLTVPARRIPRSSSSSDPSPSLTSPLELTRQIACSDPSSRCGASTDQRSVPGRNCSQRSKTRSAGS